jgi:hypothetical protein
MNRSLKQAVREHFEQRTLATDKLIHLETLMAMKTPTPPLQRHRASLLIGWSTAAAIAAFLAVIILFPPDQLEGIPMTERIALEVARNHIKVKPLDVETGTMEGIRRYFTDLEFVPVESSLLASTDIELLGGRYCSVQSVPAAQLRIAAPGNNGLQTLYQAEYHKDIFGPLPVLENGDYPININAKGISVSIWVEKGLLFALTTETDLEPIIPLE